MDRGKARVVGPDRSQLRWDLIDIEGLLAGDHRARMVWAFVEGLNLEPLYELIGSREGEAGRPPADPAVVLALWLYASLEGVGSARELARLCERDAAYRWLCGGVAVNHHGLADFRVALGEFLDGLLSESIAAMVVEGLVDLDEVTVDGTKVKASAGKGSFAGENKIARVERLGAERVARLRAEIEADPGASTRRRRAAEERAADDIAERAQRARAALDRLKAEKAERAKRHAKEEAKKGEPKASLTDPDARRMRFADGSVKAGYNVHLAASATGMVVSVMATDRRNDAGWRCRWSMTLSGAMAASPSGFSSIQITPRRTTSLRLPAARATAFWSTPRRPRNAPTSSRKRSSDGLPSGPRKRRRSRTGASAWIRRKDSQSIGAASA